MIETEVIEFKKTTGEMNEGLISIVSILKISINMENSISGSETTERHSNLKSLILL